MPKLYQANQGGSPYYASLNKDAGGLRPRYVKTLRASIKRFRLGRRQKLIADITPQEIQEYISSNGWLPATMRSYLVDVRTLFAFALKRKYVPDNTALAVDLPKVEENPPGIVTPDQARAILDASIDFAPDALPVLVLQLFGDLRRSEAEELNWEEISEEFVEVKGHIAKTRKRRLNSITPQLQAWLETARSTIGGKLPAINYADKFKLVLEKAKLREEWPQNALRHSFASYYFAKHRNENEMASLMGNSPQMVFEHYREVVRPEAAEQFLPLCRLPTLRSARKPQGNALLATCRRVNRRSPPQRCLLYSRTGKRGDLARLAPLRKRLLSLGRIYSIGQHASTVIKGVKCSLSLMGLCSGVMADPLTQFNPPERARVRAVLEELEILRPTKPAARLESKLTERVAA